MHGVPALAVSLNTERHDDEDDYAPAARLAMRVLEWMMDHPLPRGCVYNLNVPYLPYEEIKGVRAAEVGCSYLDSPNYIGVEENGETVYKYVHGVDSMIETNPDSDVVMTEEGWASLSKLTWNLQMNAEGPDVSNLAL